MDIKIVDLKEIEISSEHFRTSYKSNAKAFILNYKNAIGDNDYNRCFERDIPMFLNDIDELIEFLQNIKNL